MESDKEQSDDQRDFYWENGLMVFTAKFLLQRGTCCQSGCRHCPYGYRKADEKDKIPDPPGRD